MDEASLLADCVEGAGQPCFPGSRLAADEDWELSGDSAASQGRYLHGEEWILKVRPTVERWLRPRWVSQ
jgi:hypothetical protein